MDAGWGGTGGGGGAVITRALSNRRLKMAQGGGSQSKFKPSIYWFTVTVYCVHDAIHGQPLVPAVCGCGDNVAIILSTRPGWLVTLGREERRHSAA